MKYTHIIWDFNGTIINDLPVSFQSINTVLERRGLKPLSSYDAYRNVFCTPIINYYEKIGFDFSKEPYKIPADEWVELYNENIENIPLTVGIVETLEKIKQLGINQLILSASEINMLKNQLEYYKLTDYFSIILGCDNVYGGGKIELARKWASECRVDLESTLYIGDTDHDYETALALDCDCVLYSGGHMSKSRLKTLNVPVIDRIEDVIEFL